MPLITYLFNFDVGDEYQLGIDGGSGYHLSFIEVKAIIVIVYACYL